MLPHRAARCALPRSQFVKAGRHIPSEEAASLWMWAWPRLLGWHSNVTWLFSPVSDRHRYPGDLWGVDARGDLIIVETKFHRVAAKEDPFEDFVGFVTGEIMPSVISAHSLRARWHTLLNAELRYAQAHHRVVDQSHLSGTWPGVLPYSRHRKAIMQFPDLYTSVVLPRLKTGAYARAAERALRLRAKRDGRPIFIGLVAVEAPLPVLSRAATRSMTSLIDLIGPERVYVRGLSCRVTPSHLQIECWTPTDSR
jgi:hypothetical protein